MRKKLYIAVFAISVIGLFIVQYQYLRIGLNLARVQFEKKVDLAKEQILNDLATENRLTFLLAQSFRNEQYFPMSPDSLKDASRHFLNDFLREKLNAQKIDVDFSYQLNSKSDSIHLKSPFNFSTSAKIIQYPIKLEGYLTDKLSKNLILELQFSDLSFYFLSQLKGLLIPGLLFLGIIIFVVIWMLRLFFWQRNVITITHDFINNFTHELKTPVFSIIVAARILQHDGLKKQKPVLDLVRKQTERLNQHIENVLELANLEAGKPYVKFEITDLRPELLQWCQDYKLVSNLELFEFSFHLQPGCYRMNVSLFHLENAINNILDNSRKYADNPKISLQAFVQKNRLMINVADNGFGIPEKEIKKIFRKFYRSSEGNLHKVKGFGLGLSYLKQVVEMHRGKVELDSAPGKGTRIQIIIPLQK